MASLSMLSPMGSEVRKRNYPDLTKEQATSDQIQDDELSKVSRPGNDQ
jgi:hypothetical protein